MSARICLLSCQNFAQELAATIGAEGWTDVEVQAFPARCGKPPLDWHELRPLVAGNCSQVVVIGRACLGSLGDPPPGFPPVRMLIQQQCFHVVAGPSLVDDAIASGAYLMTPAWLADWPRRLADLGFPKDGADGLFRDFASELTLLDTGIDPDAPLLLAEISRAVGLPARRLAVGLDFTRAWLTQLVLSARLDDERRASREAAHKHHRELADSLSAMDMLAQLAAIQDEGEVVAAVKNLFQMLFAAGELYYLPFEAGHFVSDFPPPPELLRALDEMAGSHAWTPSGKGFMVRFERAGHVVGAMVTDHLAFPEHRQRYLNLALAMAGVCALAIESARNYRLLVEAEKMASLGRLVAGFAHEINTPIGIAVGAVTHGDEAMQAFESLLEQAEVKESELKQGLADMRASGALALGNLRRAADLVHRFKRASIDQTAALNRPFLMAEVVQDVLASLRSQTKRRSIRITVVCPEDLALFGAPGLYEQIFTNLLLNSLTHGFPDAKPMQPDAAIDIEIHVQGERAEIQFSDNGAGMEAMVASRIFEPFFTTRRGQGGSGLGLFIVYNIVTTDLGGSIRCDTSPGKGARFQITVPLHFDTTAQAGPAGVAT